jgi:hypothetical protein
MKQVICPTCRFISLVPSATHYTEWTAAGKSRKLLPIHCPACGGDLAGAEEYQDRVLSDQIPPVSDAEREAIYRNLNMKEIRNE